MKTVLKIAFIYQKLRPQQQQVLDQIMAILSLLWVENVFSRGSTSHVNSELIFIPLESAQRWKKSQSFRGHVLLTFKNFRKHVSQNVHKISKIVMIIMISWL